jgi:hypothetical protein
MVLVHVMEDIMNVSLRTFFQVHVAVLVIKVIAALGAVELVVRIHLAVIGGGSCGSCGQVDSRNVKCLLLPGRLFCRA